MDNKLAAAVIHDLKNSLAVLENDLGKLAASEPDEAKVAAHRLCVSLRQRLVSFLTLYRANELGLTPRIDSVAPDDFLKETVAGLVRTEQAPPITIGKKPGAPAFWFFDEYLVGLALEAALQNATRFARSKIEIDYGVRDGWLVFTVHDDGPGLGVEEDVPSTGLGTHLCEAISAAHRKGERAGKTTLGNAAAGGCTFELWLP